MLNAGDVLNFDQRHYGIYDGKDIVQIPEWGADPERVDMKSVFKSNRNNNSQHKEQRIGVVIWQTY
jgi:hypothetical protein